MIGRTRRVLPLGVGGLAVLLASCSVPIPEPSETPTLEHLSALADRATDRVVQETTAEFAVADEARDASLLGLRVGETAQRIRAVEYAIAAKGGDSPVDLGDSIQAFYTVDSQSWPRVLVGVASEDPDRTPLVLTWVQEGPRDPYRVSLWASLVPGTTLPAMPRPEDGTSYLSLDAEGYTLTPAEAIAEYASLLNAGEGEEAVFSPDPFLSGMFDARQALQASAQGRGGTYTDTVTARLEESFALADAEGGALVFARFEVVSDFSVPGAQLTLPGAEAAVLEGTLSSRVVHRYEDLVVIRIWAEGVSVLPTVVAAGHHLVRVSTS